MAWRYGLAKRPIQHEAGTVPPRPLLPGDIVTYESGATEMVNAASDSNLLQLIKENGKMRIEFRGPLEGDMSGVIVGIPAND